MSTEELEETHHNHNHSDLFTPKELIALFEETPVTDEKIINQILRLEDIEIPKEHWTTIRNKCHDYILAAPCKPQSKEDPRYEAAAACARMLTLCLDPNDLDYIMNVVDHGEYITIETSKAFVQKLKDIIRDGTKVSTALCPRYAQFLVKQSKDLAANLDKYRASGCVNMILSLYLLKEPAFYTTLFYIKEYATDEFITVVEHSLSELERVT